MTAGGVTDNNERLGRKAMAHRDVRALLQMTPMPYWATTTLIGLGLAASLAETLGISRAWLRWWDSKLDVAVCLAML
jgi:hypothetical protein